MPVILKSGEDYFLRLFGKHFFKVIQASDCLQVGTVTYAEELCTGWVVNNPVKYRKYGDTEILLC